MDIVLVTSMRLLGESLVRCLQEFDDIRVVSELADCTQFIAALNESDVTPQIALLDVTHGVDFTQVKFIATRWPDLPLLALGLQEQQRDVINCGRAGFAGYVARDASLAQLRQAVLDAAAGRLSCPTYIAAGLLRALHGSDSGIYAKAPANQYCEENCSLTRRESEVASFIARGLSNKEIARALNVSVATVKHHVHNVLTKLNLPTRSRVARVMKDSARPAHYLFEADAKVT